MDANPLTRRRALAAGATLLGSLSGCLGTGGTTGSAQTTADSTQSDGSLADLALQGDLVLEGLTAPVDVAVPAADEYFVVDQAGEIRYRDAEGEDETFLDVTDQMVEINGFSEQGLLGMALHPEYAENGRFFVRYSAPPRDGTPDDFSHTFVLSEFEADPESATVDPASERAILEIPEPQPNHNAGAIAFGPDGYLYVAVGDGGGSADSGTGHVEDWYDAVPGGNGQDVTENLLGSMLRIDVDSEPDGDRAYAIPEDNPLVGEDGLDEHYAWGFRNPWRFSFGPDGRLFVGDVGENDYEEVSVVQMGGNYGWNVREGTHCFQADECPDETPDSDPLLSPIIEYSQEDGTLSGVSVIGGYLYEGEEIPALQGRYVFADWQADGELFVATEADDGLWPTQAVPVDGIGSNVLSFGQTPENELLVCTSENGGVDGSSGAVYRLEAA